MKDNGSPSGRSLLGRVAGAPISWGICEVPGWGLQLPVERVLSEMHDLGLAATELGAIGWLPTDADELMATLDAHGLRAVGAFVPLVAHDEARRNESIATANEMAGLLQSVGAAHFVTALVNDPDDWSRPALADQQWAHLIDVVDEVDEIADAHGLGQVLHPHLNTLVETADELARFLEDSDVPICLDTGHITLGGGDPLELARRHADRVALVHLKDVRADVASRLASGEFELMAAVQAGLFAPLGAGDVAVADVIVELERQGYDGLYVLEQDVAITGGAPRYGAGPARDVATSVAYLRSLEPTLRAMFRSGDGSTDPSPTTT